MCKPSTQERTLTVPDKSGVSQFNGEHFVLFVFLIVNNGDLDELSEEELKAK